MRKAETGALGHEVALQWQETIERDVELFSAILCNAATTGGKIELLDGIVYLKLAYGADEDMRNLVVTHEYERAEGLGENGDIYEQPYATKYVIGATDATKILPGGRRQMRWTPFSIAAKTYDLTEETRLKSELSYRRIQEQESEGLEGINDPELALQALHERIVRLEIQKGHLVAARDKDLPPFSQIISEHEVEKAQDLQCILEETAKRQPAQNARIQVSREFEE